MIEPYSACAELGMKVGEVCEPPQTDARGVWEPWAVAPPGTVWTIQNEVNVAVDAASAAFDGRIIITPDDERTNPAVLSLRSLNCLDLTGKSVLFRAAPMDGPGRYAGLIIEAHSGGFGSTEIYIELLGREGPDDLDFSIFGDSIFEYTRITYDPDDHLWWRVRHVAGTGTLYLETSAFCEEWAVRESAVVGDTWKGHDIVLFQVLGDTPDAADTAGEWGQVYIVDSVPAE